MSPEDERQIQLDVLAEEFVSRTRSGQHPTVAEYAEAHPDLAPDIEEIFPLLAAMESVKEEPPEGELAPGAEIGDYRLLRVIGRGGMGVVYEAEQKTLGRRVALKVLPQFAHLDPRTVERFRVEAQAAARLEHPRIVPVIGYGQVDGVHFYTMQYIEGRGLDEVIRAAHRTGSVDPGHYRHAARVALHAAEGIAHAHANGVLHRDVKPSNVMLDGDDQVWITDFGLCKAEDTEDLTYSGDVLGTIRYLAPERFGGTSDARGDVYGLGITLYELLTRRQAYEGTDRAAIAARIATEPPPRPRAHDPLIPSDLETIVRKATAHDPEQRYATVDALAADLSAFLDGRPIAARTPSFGYVLRRAIGRHKAVTATILVALLLLIGSTVWYVLDLREKERRARLRQYAASIAAAEAALRVRDSHRAAVLLAEAPQEFRNWEWRHLSGRLDPGLRRFESRPVNIQSVTYHPSGTVFAAAGGEEVTFYDDASGAIVGRVHIEAEPRCVRWSPQGDRLAVGTYETLEIWSWPACERLFTSSPEGEFRWVEYASEGDVLVCGVVSGLLFAFDAKTGAELSRKRTVTRLLSLACSPAPDSGIVAAGDGDGRVTVYELDDWTPRWSRSVSRHGVHSVFFPSPDRLACSAQEGFVRLWDVESGEEIATFASDRHAGSLVPDPTGRRLMVFGLGQLHVFDADGRRLLNTLSGGSLPHRAALHPDGRRAIVASATGTVREWFLGEGGDPLVLTGPMDDVVTADIDARGHLAASGGFGGIVRLWDLETGELARAFLGHSVIVTHVRFSPDGQSLAAAYDDGWIVVRDVPSGRVLRRWQAHAEPASALAYLPDGERLIRTSSDGRLVAWTPSTGTQVGEVVVEEAPETGVDGTRPLAVSQDGRWIACGTEDGRIQLIDGRTLRPVRPLTGHAKEVRGLAFHPHDEILVSVSIDQTLRLWDLASGDSIRSSTRHDPELAWSAGLNRVAFSPDGSRIATGSFSGPVRLWATEEVRLLATLGQEHWVTEIHFSPDGTRLLTPLTNGTVRIWDSVPLRDRAPAYEQAAARRTKARPLVEGMVAQGSDCDAMLDMLTARTDLADDLRESALRIVHRRRTSRDAHVERMWRDLMPRDPDPDRLQEAVALAQGIWRATRRREQPDSRCDTLLGLAYHRTHEPERMLQVFALIGPRNEARAPGLYAIDLALAAMSHRALDEPEQARAQLEELDTLLRDHPELRTQRVERLLVEAHER